METQKPILSYKQGFYIAAIGVLLLVIANLYQGCENKQALAEKDSMYEAISDSLKTWKDKDGIEHSEKQTVQSNNPNEFLKARSNDAEVIALQKLVKQYKKQLGKQGSVALIKGETIIDTFYTKPIVTYVDRTFYKDSIKNKWIDWNYKVARPEKATKDSVNFKLKLNYEYAVIYKEESNGWFKKPTPYAEVVNYNPYSTTVSLTTYRVVNDIKTKKIGIGTGFYYGIGNNFQSQVLLGVGVQYNFIRF